MEDERRLEFKVCEEWRRRLNNPDYRVISFNAGTRVPIGSILVSTNAQFSKAREVCVFPAKRRPPEFTNGYAISMYQHTYVEASGTFSPPLSGAGTIPVTGGMELGKRQTMWVNSKLLRQSDVAKDDLIDGILNAACAKEVLGRRGQTLFAVGGHLFVTNSIAIGREKNVKAFVKALSSVSGSVGAGTTGVAYAHSDTNGTCYLLVTTVPTERFEAFQKAQAKNARTATAKNARAVSRAKARLLERPKK